MTALGFTDLESSVLTWLLDGEEPVLVLLQNQLSAVTSISRKMTGQGFYLYFTMPSTVKKTHEDYLVKPNFCFGDVEASTSSLQRGIGFLLWIKGGVLNSLEGYTYEENWPSKIDKFELKYFSGVTRDWDKLRHQWEVAKTFE